ncbi:MAG: 3-deoxy-7-phosphoheptulonate synthase [Planctomycetes bacterium]|nr:3-deoxy-7-phosphoheptulonate synthase [Planctomycetota bacterium]
MLVVMQTHATPDEIDHVVDAIRAMNLTPHPMPGATRTAIGITGNIGAVDSRTLEVLPGVSELIRVTKPFKLASREMHEADTLVAIPMGQAFQLDAEASHVRLESLTYEKNVTIGPGTCTMIAGPCSVENEAMILRTAEFMMENGVRLMRAGAFKPRTSPYSFQGTGLEGLKILARARQKTGIGIVTELLDTDNAEAVEDATDIIQIGTRNMQNFALLKRVGMMKKPVLLKRGMSATLEDWLMAAEYIMAGGNYNVILCERGIRSFSDHSRNTLDLSVIPPAKKLSHLPVMVDPSHGVGKREFVPQMALAALAAGADGLLLEVHPDPDHAASDGAQSLSFDGFKKLLESLRKLAEPLGKRLN